jgi:hypothetical protein
VAKGAAAKAKSEAAKTNLTETETAKVQKETAKMSTVPVYDLDEGEDVIQPSAGWHTAILTSLEINPNKAGTGTNIVVGLELDEGDPDRPGMPWTYYVPLPTAEVTEDYKAWQAAGRPKASAWDVELMTKDGRHKYQASIARIKKLSSALGGPESGGFDPAVLGRMVGKKVKINLTPEREGGVPTGRMQIGFDGLAPA